MAADVDEVEFGFTAAEGLDLVVRHSFTADWGVRVAFVNHTLEPLSLDAELSWAPPPECPAWALAAGVTAAYAIPGPDGAGPLLGGELVLGTCDEVTDLAIGLGRFELGPLERRVVQWRWDWYASPRAFHRNRFASVPRDLVLPDNESARILADDDTAVVAPGVDTVRRGPHLELSSPGAQRVERRGPVAPRGDGVRAGVGRLARRGAGRASVTDCWRDRGRGPVWPCWAMSTPPWSSSTCWSADGWPTRTRPTTRSACSWPGRWRRTRWTVAG